MSKQWVKEVVCHDGWTRGEKDAMELIKKGNSLSIQAFDKIQHEIESRIETKYKSESKRWKQCYKIGSRKRIEGYMNSNKKR
jgi:hypothetical protein